MLFATLLLLSAIGVIRADLPGCLLDHGLRTITSSDPEYDTLRFSYNHRVDVQPAAIVLPASTVQVSAAVRCARSFSTEFSVRSGKHSYEGYGVQAGALLIDMSTMKTVALLDADEVWLDVGLTLGEVYYHLAEVNRTLPGGTCAGVGLGGHVLGGGFGVRSRQYGLMIDQVVAFEMVDVEGAVIVADASQHGDLFWALLGAGQGQFGIVTRIRFRTVPARPVIHFEYPYAVTATAAAIRFLQGFAADPAVPSQLYMSLSLVRSRNFIVLFGEYIGTRAEFDVAIARSGIAEQLGVPETATVTEYSYIDSILSLANLPAKSPPAVLLSDQSMSPTLNWKARSGFVKKPIADDGLEAVAAAFFDDREPAFPIWDAYMLIDTWGGAVADPANGQRSAFAHRDALLSVQSWVSWSTGDPIEVPLRQWQNQVWSVLHPNLSGAFVNYADGDLDDYMSAYYGDSSSQLVAVKSKYDPGNAMRFAQSIPVDPTFMAVEDVRNGDVRFSSLMVVVIAVAISIVLFQL